MLLINKVNQNDAYQNADQHNDIMILNIKFLKVSLCITKMLAIIQTGILLSVIMVTFVGPCPMIDA